MNDCHFFAPISSTTNLPNLPISFWGIRGNKGKPSISSHLPTVRAALSREELTAFPLLPDELQVATTTAPTSLSSSYALEKHLVHTIPRGGGVEGTSSSSIRNSPFSSLLRSDDDEDFGNQVRFNFGDSGGFGNGDGDGDDSYSEVFYDQDSSSAGNQIKNSLIGLFIGPIVIMASCWFLWNNEGWAIKRHRSLMEALLAVQSIGDGSVYRKIYDGQLVHITNRISVDRQKGKRSSRSSSSSSSGVIATNSDSDVVAGTHSGGAEDIEFGLKRNAVSINRNVEIYQWVESKRETSRRMSDGSTQRKVTYSYHKKWTKRPVSSSNFRRKEGHDNYGELPFESNTFYANRVGIGAYKLSPDFTKQLTSSTSISPHEVKHIPQGGMIVGSSIYFPILNISSINSIGHTGTKTITSSSSSSSGVEPTIVSMDGQDKILFKVISTGEMFTSKQDAIEKAAISTRASPPKPVIISDVKTTNEAQIGDVRVRFSEVKCTTTSVLGKVDGKTITSWSSKQGRGYDIALLKKGKSNASTMIQEAQDMNQLNTWCLRGGGFLFNFVGFSMITSIISTTANITLNWIPLLGPMTTSIVSLGVSIANFVLATSLSLLVISIGWLYYRPIIGMPLFLFSFGFFYVASQMGVGVGDGKNQKFKNR